MLFSGLYVLWPDPLVVSCLDGAELMAALRIPRSADVIAHPTWLLTYQSLPRIVRNVVRARQLGKRIHFMACADESHRLLRRLGLRGRLVNISAYLDERTWRITGAAKEYDAVYAARMAAYKRLHLASKVSSLFVQTYGDVLTANGEYDLHRFEPSIRHCAFNRGWVSEPELVEILNRARVGLALSKCEGAMLASVEYMLCGLPLVSTRCRGGREQFFDDRYVQIVDDSPDAVAAGVQAILTRRIEPQLVREETLKKLRPHRERLCEYVVEIIRTRGATPPTPAAVFERLFEAERGARGRFVHLRDFAAHGFVPSGQGGQPKTHM
jgi:glycosyltransferase involved in cell wall biosynthesis